MQPAQRHANAEAKIKPRRRPARPVQTDRTHRRLRGNPACLVETRYIRHAPSIRDLARRRSAGSGRDCHGACPEVRGKRWGVLETIVRGSRGQLATCLSAVRTPTRQSQTHPPPVESARRKTGSRSNQNDSSRRNARPDTAAVAPRTPGVARKHKIGAIESRCSRRIEASAPGRRTVAPACPDMSRGQLATCLSAVRTPTRQSQSHPPPVQSARRKTGSRSNQNDSSSQPPDLLAPPTPGVG